MTRLHDKTDGTNKIDGPGHSGGFLRSEDGSMIIFGLMIFVMILMVGGMGVDFMRFEAQRARLQATLDRAVLAAASMSQPLEPEDVVLDYFDRAGLGDYIERDDIVATNNLVARSVEATATMSVPSLFLNLVGITELEAPASGMAAQSAGKAEISLVLDISGSMGRWSYSGGARKLDILKDSATQFVNIVLCDPSDPTKTTDCIVPQGQVSMSLVPYAHEVSIGPDLAAAFNVTDEHTQSACVDFSDEDFETTAISDETELQRAGYFDPYSGASSAFNPNNVRDCRTDDMREVLPIQDNAELLRERVDDLWASGNTSIDTGMKWGAALLDPAMQPVTQTLHDDGLIDADLAERPFPWTEGQIQKVVVLMTDGQNTTYNHLDEGYYDGAAPVWRSDSGVLSIYRASTEQYWWDEDSGNSDVDFDEGWYDHPFGEGEFEQCDGNWVQESYRDWRGRLRWRSVWVEECEMVEEDTGVARLTYPQLWASKPLAWYQQWWWLGDPETSEGYYSKNARLDDICTASKAAGITIFTIGFETNSSTASVLRSCASTDSHFFDVDGLDLTDAFASIAREISQLRLVN